MYRGREGPLGEVAEAVAWLCSDAASFTTGHAMVIDGGYLAKQQQFHKDDRCKGLQPSYR